MEDKNITLLNTTEYPMNSSQNWTSVDYDLEATYMMLEASYYLSIIRSKVIAPLGILFSVLSLIVLQKSKLSDTSFSFYLQAIAFCDGCYFTVDFIFELVRYISSYTKWVCGVGKAFSYLFSVTSYWLIVTVSIDRFIVITRPIKAKILSRRKIGRMVTSVIFFIMLGLSSTVIWLFDATTDGLDCVFTSNHSTLYFIISIVDVLFMVVFMVVLIFNAIFTIYSLRKQAKDLQTLTGKLSILNK